MPNLSGFNSESEWMHACVPKMMQDKGMQQDQAVAACKSMWAGKGDDTPASKSEMSLEDKSRALRNAFFDLTHPPMPPSSNAMIEPQIMETFADHIIVCMGKDEYYKVGYSLDENGKVKFDPKSKWAAVQESWAAKFAAVKAIGDWEIDVLAIPFDSKDSDGQWFDARTDIMPDTFNSPLIVYQHGIKQGARGMQDKPVKIGQAVPGSLAKRADGWHIKVILDKASKFARATMEAVKQGMAAVSSGSVLHLARLDVGGRLIPYEKDKPGRIAVWPFAELSLWEKGGGNMMPANRFAVALPAMKAFYRDAGQPFPDLQPDHTSQRMTPEKRAQIAQLRAESKQILSRTDRYFPKET